jgi:hypothetical protein
VAVAVAVAVAVTVTAGAGATQQVVGGADTVQYAGAHQQ